MKMDGKQKKIILEKEVLEKEVKILKELSDEFPGMISEVSIKGKKIFPKYNFGDDIVGNIVGSIK
jgi:hypothetical protein